MVNIIFNGKNIEVDDNLTILEVAESQGVEIPTLCHDNRLDPYGSCFVCVVEVKGARTLLPACSTKIRPDMEISTTSEKAMSSRKTALELILSNHSGDCIAPCQLGCPARTDVQGYVGLVANGQYDDAIQLIKKDIPLPASIGRVCPKFCENDCRRKEVDEPIAIDYIKRFAADYDLAKDKPYMPICKPSIGKKVAVIGAGPAGLSVAYFLKQEGVDVEIFEAQEDAGGMLRYGIPEYRLPKKVLSNEIKTITDLNIKINYNTKLGKDFTIDSLKSKGYEAIFLGFGAWKPTSLRLENGDVEGIIDGIAFLENVVKGKQAKLFGKVAVVGGGNTAFDCARTALRYGADEVTMIYRRTKKEMPANEVEKEEAEEEGIKFNILTNPSAVLQENGKLKGLTCIKMELGEPDESGRRRPVPIENSEFNENFDYVITAVGQGPDMSVLGEYHDKITDGKWMKYDKATGTTDIDFIFAGGDCAIGAATVVEAIGTSHEAARSIVKYLNGEKINKPKEFLSKREDLGGVTEAFLSKFEKAPREKIEILDPEKRRRIFDEIESVFTEEKTVKEANRCMECGCMDLNECSLKKYAEDYDCEDNHYQGDVNIFDEDNKHPFIFREPSKCILCGRCIRLCAEKVNLSIYGYVDRGFQTTVSPEFGKSLADSDCISCGLCISGCPVGALVPKKPEMKKVPLKGEITSTNCYHCSLGCKIDVETLKDSIYDIHLGGKYICKKGRFNQPDYFPSCEDKDFATLKSFKDAIVYPSPTLSAEDYESLKNVSDKMNWKISNYYSQGSLWQAFAEKNVLPSMDFFEKPISEKSLVIIAGDIEQINPVTYNILQDKKLKDTKFILVNKELGNRSKNLNAQFVSNIDKLDITDIDSYSEIVLLINPVNLDESFGFGASLKLYNMLVKSQKLRTTLFSEARNLYSFYDAHKETNLKDNIKKIYIGTLPEKFSGKDQINHGILLLEKDNPVCKYNIALSFQNSGHYLNSKHEIYSNTPFKNENTKTLTEIFKEAFQTEDPTINEILTDTDEKLFTKEYKPCSFGKDCFIMEYSHKK